MYSHTYAHVCQTVCIKELHVCVISAHACGAAIHVYGDILAM